MLRVSAPAKVVWFGEHYVHRTGAVASAVDRRLVLLATPDPAVDDLTVDDNPAAQECARRVRRAGLR